jgi:hypothetical protein
MPRVVAIFDELDRVLDVLLDLLEALGAAVYLDARNSERITPPTWTKMTREAA